jgi:hypothetical protein
MNKTLTLFSLFSIGLCIAQTKTIYSKRHFVLDKNNSTVFTHHDHITSNFGAAPERWARNSKLVKVTLLNDTCAIMTTEEDCYETYSRTETKWRAGSDTVYNHAIFCAKIPVDSMRTILNEQYYFTNDMSKVQFDGFENSKKAERNIYTNDDDRVASGTLIQFDLITKKDVGKQELGQDKTKKNRTKWVLIIVIVTTVLGISRIR